RAPGELRPLRPRLRGGRCAARRAAEHLAGGRLEVAGVGRGAERLWHQGRVRLPRGHPRVRRQEERAQSETAMSIFLRFPRTPHLAWLAGGSPRGDKLLPPDEVRELLLGEVIVEE